MERRKKIQISPDTWADVTEVGFRSSGENWNEYLADDGTVIRIKLVVTEVLRIDGQYDEQGNPAYLIKSSNVTAVSAPDDMRKDGT